MQNTRTAATIPFLDTRPLPLRNDRPRSDDSTQVGTELPWTRGGVRSARALHLVVAWHAHEPYRVGNSAAVTRESTLGRGVGDGCEARVEFVRQRPGLLEPTGGLHCPRLSRAQLRLTPGAERLLVQNIGRCKLLHNGLPTQSAEARAGDVITLEDSLVLLVEERERLWPESAYGSEIGFEFGAADECGLVGESEGIWRLREELRAAAHADAHALITGSSGVGKELAGRALHAWSRRAHGPLVARNAATFPDTLIDAELFGNVKNFPNVGSPERAGLVGEADGGTLILDEVGELPAAQQAHLLRVLDAGGEYQRLGESRARRSNLRVLGLTNRALDELKLDFLARFSLRVKVPDLAERPSDIPLLMRWIWRALAAEQPELKQRFPSANELDADWEPLVEPRLVELLLRSELSHNTRDLERVLRMAVLSSGQRYVGMSPTIEAELSQVTSDVTSVNLDREAIVEALATTQGSPTKAAKQLGLKNRHVLYRLMKKFEIEPRAT